MGIVASIVATPVAQAVAEDEARRELVRIKIYFATHVYFFKH